MLTEADIERAARSIIDKHGGNAARAAEDRVKRLSTERQAEAAATWRRIERAIYAILADKAAAD